MSLLPPRGCCLRKLEPGAKLNIEFRYSDVDVSILITRPNALFPPRISFWVILFLFVQFLGPSSCLKYLLSCPRSLCFGALSPWLTPVSCDRQVCPEDLCIPASLSSPTEHHDFLFSFFTFRALFSTYAIMHVFVDTFLVSFHHPHQDVRTKGVRMT